MRRPTRLPDYSTSGAGLDTSVPLVFDTSLYYRILPWLDYAGTWQGRTGNRLRSLLLDAVTSAGCRFSPIQNDWDGASDLIIIGHFQSGVSNGG